MLKRVSERCGVYAIEQIGADRFYIGSSKAIYKRWLDHRRYLDDGAHHAPFLQNCWSKHGEDSFLFYVLEECAPDQLLVREQAYLDTFRPVFNVCLVGGSRRGVPATPETRKRLSAIARARAARITHCPRGHGYTPENTYLNQGKRICRACGNERMRIVFATETHEQRERRRQRVKSYYDRHRDGRSARWSVEHRARISAGLMGRVISPETRAKLRAANLGKTRLARG